MRVTGVDLDRIDRKAYNQNTKPSEPSAPKVMITLKIWINQDKFDKILASRLERCRAPLTVLNTYLVGGFGTTRRF